MGGLACLIATTRVRCQPACDYEQWLRYTLSRTSAICELLRGGAAMDRQVRRQPLHICHLAHPTLQHPDIGPNLILMRCETNA